MEPWKHEDRSSSGCSRQLSSRPLRSQDHDQLSICRWNSHTGEDRERDKQNVTERIMSGNGLTWNQVRTVKKDDQIASTRSFSTSRRWRQIPRLGINISFRIYVFFAMVNSNMAKFLAKRRWNQEEIPTWNSSIPSSNSRPFWRKTHWSYIARQPVVTERLRRAHLSRWKLPWLAHHPVWIDSEWENVKKGRHAVFFTAVNPMFVDQHKEVEYDLTKPRIAVYKPQLKITPKYRKIGVIWGLLRVKVCISIKHDPTQSFFTTLHSRCASRRWWTSSQEKNCTVKCISFLSYRKDLYLSRIWIVDARIPPTLKREYPSTILAECTLKPVAVGSIGRPFAETSTSESKECHIQLSNNKMTPERKQSKSWFINLTRIQIAKLWNSTW